MPTKLMRQHPDSKQAQARALAVWFDQHRDSQYRNAQGEKMFEYGRPWWSVIEKSSGMPTGPVYPMGWDAPWMVPQQYIADSIGRIAKQELTQTIQPKNVNSDRFRIAYERMAKDDRDATQMHYQLAVTVATNKNLPIPKWGDVMDARLVTIVGVQPRSPKIAEAALAGNKWLLGQLMPTPNAVTGKMEVEEDEQLARLLRMHSESLWTPEQAERDAETQAIAQSEVKALFDEVVAMKKEMAAERAAMDAERAAKATKVPKKPAKAEV